MITQTPITGVFTLAESFMTDTSFGRHYGHGEPEFTTVHLALPVPLPTSGEVIPFLATRWGNEVTSLGLRLLVT